MSNAPQLNNTTLVETLVSKYGVKSTVIYFLKQGKDAAGRAKVDLSGQNIESFTANAQVMIETIDTLMRILGDDTTKIDK